jgi:hypothetical protein
MVTDDDFPIPTVKTIVLLNQSIQDIETLAFVKTRPEVIQA